MDDFNLVSGDGVLHPALAAVDTIPNLADRRLQVGANPTAATLIELIIDDIPLNTKQRLIVERVLSAALSWTELRTMLPREIKFSSTSEGMPASARAKSSLLLLLRWISFIEKMRSSSQLPQGPPLTISTETPTTPPSVLASRRPKNQLYRPGSEIVVEQDDHVCGRNQHGRSQHAQHH
jgi:hypothetical protein